MGQKPVRLARSGLGSLLGRLKEEGYEVWGPRLAGAAIEWGRLGSVEELPAGWTQESQAGRYRLTPRGDGAWFGYWTGMDSLKRLMHSPDLTLTRAEASPFRIWNEAPTRQRRAFLGVRGCDLAALERLDRVLLNDLFRDEHYEAARADSFLIAVNCTESAPTCFCESLGTGPYVTKGADIVLTERAGEEDFLAQGGSARGRKMLEGLGEPGEWVLPAARGQQRSVDLRHAPEILDAAFENPHWDRVARRCLSCGNCTSVCPTCFCVNIEDVTPVDGQTASRVRRWDSCFTQSFSYIHGGSVRGTTRSRYRQWLSHKLGRWQAQFGTPGCTGCGRCIVWCPAGIDLTEEFNALAAAPAQGGLHG